MDSSDITPIDKAVFDDAMDMKGVDIDVRDSGGRTAMHHTARDNAVDVMEWF